MIQYERRGISYYANYCLAKAYEGYIDAIFMLALYDVPDVSSTTSAWASLQQT